MRTIEAGDGVTIRVRTIGEGSPVLLIPSLGRGVDDYDEVADLLTGRGFKSILPDPRGIGGSSGPAPADLFDLARDAAAVITDFCSGPIGVVGHAFGNRVARALAAIAPETVERVVLLAGGGQTAMSDTVRAALIGSVAQGSKPDADRLEDLETAFFFPGNDPAIWLRGWYPAVAEQQLAANERTDTARWWTAGNASVLLVQAEGDPVAPASNAEALAADIGDRLIVVRLRRASHAILPEQLHAVAALIADYLRGESDSAALQDTADRLIA
ncbi:MAG TPA: alpha/beta fold hydrolase [Sphingomonas sp.]|nr:alpha/beta fold hydrolase [Sphingomonas sp.]